MREIGGYLELDTYHLPMLHENAIALNSGRNALAYLLKSRKIRKLWIPKYICDSIPGVCSREKVVYSFYSIGMDFLPEEEITLGNDEWFYFVNYFSQFSNKEIAEIVDRYKRVIVDQAQSYFQLPIPNVDTLYTCRKYFGVTDGAFLYTDSLLIQELPIDESFNRMQFVLGRYERPASEYYSNYVSNNELFISEPIKRMSKLTSNLLHGVDYKKIKSIRESNYMYLYYAFGGLNILHLNNTPGSFMYPLLVENGSKLRKRLHEKKIYIPTLWPDVFGWCSKDEVEYYLAENILPIPIDQRYGEEDMKYIVSMVMEVL